MREQLTANSFVASRCANVCVTNQRYLCPVLYSHHTHDYTVIRITPKIHALVNLSFQVLLTHVRFMPTIRRDHALINGCSIIYDLENFAEICWCASLQHCDFYFNRDLSVYSFQPWGYFVMHRRPAIEKFS